MKWARVKQHEQRVVFGAAFIGVWVQTAQQRVVAATRGNQPKRQVVVLGDGLDDRLAAFAHHMKFAVQVVIAQHRIELLRRPPLRFEYFLKRRACRCNE